MRPAANKPLADTLTMVCIYLLCGLAFAGKSTLARAIASRTGAVLVSLDAINERRGLHGGLGVPDAVWAEAHQTALRKAEDVVARGAPVVVDDTNCFRFLRDDYRALASGFGVKCLVVYVDAPLSLALSRLRENEATLVRPRVTEAVLLELARRFEAPDADEPHLSFTPGTNEAAWVAANLASDGPSRVG
ncbi:MAG: ATP-binding protein [Acidobacteriota bacterium]